MRILLLVGAAATLAACNNNGSPLPPTGSYTVTVTPETAYTGTISDAVEGTGSIDVLIQTSGESSIGGIWDESFNGQKTTTRFITGTLNGNSYNATVSDCDPASSQPCKSTCQLTFTGSLTSNTLSGSYAEVDDSCSTTRRGTISAATNK